MPRLAAELSALKVGRIKTSGKHAVGYVAGLYLNVTENGARSWILRFRFGHKRREMGLGPYPEVSLASARQKAAEARESIRQHRDPLQDRTDAKLLEARVQKGQITFSVYCDQFLTSHKISTLKNVKHRMQWRSTLETYAYPHIGSLAINSIETEDILNILQPIWREKTETASRLRGRLERVLAAAAVEKLRATENPARWKGNLSELLPAASKMAKKTGHHPALAHSDLAEWFTQLRDAKGFAAQALVFLTYTAARSGEVRKATWSEIDFDAKLWVVPATRMKAGVEHRVPLSAPAMDLLRSIGRDAESSLLFPGQSGKPMSDMTLAKVMKRLHDRQKEKNGAGWIDPRQNRAAVPHGLRSTFRDWVSETTNYPREVAEMALAHRVGNAVEQAYQRGDMLEKRVQLMRDWSVYVRHGEVAN